jgi:hypothetical protein
LKRRSAGLYLWHDQRNTAIHGIIVVEPSDLAVDECVGDNSTCSDRLGVQHGAARLDACAVYSDPTGHRLLSSPSTHLTRMMKLKRTCAEFPPQQQQQQANMMLSCASQKCDPLALNKVKPQFPFSGFTPLVDRRHCCVHLFYKRFTLLSNMVGWPLCKHS